MSSPFPSRVLVAGAGYVGLALATRLAEEGAVVYALRRRPENVTRAPGSEPSIRWLQADVGDPSTLGDLPSDLDAVVYLVSAGERAEPAYRTAYVDGPRNLLRALRPASALRFLFVSSTAVYGDADGDWVDETSPTDPDGFAGRILLEGERLALDSAVDPVVVRFSGIYGPGRTRLIDRVRAGEARCLHGPDWTNRIHRDDCAGFLRHLLGIDPAHRLYLGTDDEPADRCEVYRWLAAQLGAPEPTLDPEPPGSPRRAGNKRCRNDRLRASGYRLRYPGFREGYGELLAGLGF